MDGRQRPQPIRVISDSITADLQVACGAVIDQDASGIVISGMAGPDGTSTRTKNHAASLGLSSMRSKASPAQAVINMASPPTTPPGRTPGNAASLQAPLLPRQHGAPDLQVDIKDAEILGSGLWSNVYKVTLDVPGPQAAAAAAAAAAMGVVSPPATPQKTPPTRRQVFAVKVASRSDAVEVFQEEARILADLQSRPSSTSFIIPFHGLINSSTALLFEYAPMTLETYAKSTALGPLLASTPSIATNLIAGLAFLHSCSLVHADIKPANILLTPRPGLPPLARHADFSASFLSPVSVSAFTPPSALPTPEPSPAPSRSNSQKKSVAAAGGGTWPFMAPEQLLSNPQLSEPTYASDVYALGVTLLALLLGGESPYRELEACNVFLYREAVKQGDPLAFVNRDPGLRTRLFVDVQADVVGRRAIEALKGAVRRRREERWSAEEWRLTAERIL